MNALGVYWSPWHRRPTDYEYFMALQPAAFKIMDGGQPDYEWARLNLPGTLVLARDWAMSEQKSDMLADPAGTGARHAWEWSEKADALGYDPANTLVLGINEPPVWDPGVIPSLTAYTVAFLDGCAQHGLRGGALQLSVGWPANTGEGQPPDWAPYAEVEAAIQRGRHALVLHEYWADAGPGENWGWWGGRFMSCPWDVPIIIGECGIDMYVKYGGGYEGTRGWTGHDAPLQYADECVQYVRLCQQDARFFAATPFTTDYANQEWGSFDTNPARNELISVSASLAPAFWHEAGQPVPPEPEPTPPATGALCHPLPADSFYYVTQDFYQHEASGYAVQGHDGTDLSADEGTAVYAMAEGIAVWVDFDPAYGNYIRLYHDDMEVCTFYAHLSEQRVQMGDTVTAGQLIGLVGSTGNSTGPHLHLSVRSMLADGTYNPAAPLDKGCIDPRSWCALFGLNLATGQTVSAAAMVYLPITAG
jgi:hypothetical protein